MTDLIWPELYFVRHGETPWNAERRYQGRKDIPLNQKGESQALGNGRLLRKVLEERGVDPASLEWHASPLTRTRQTMERIRQAFDKPLPAVIYDPLLVEISFGNLEGLLHDELPANMATAPGGRDASYWHFRPEAGENYEDVAERLREFGRKLKGPSVVVAHGGVARTLRALIENAPIADVMNWPPPQDMILHFQHGVLELLGGD